MSLGAEWKLIEKPQQRSPIRDRPQCCPSWNISRRHVTAASAVFHAIYYLSMLHSLTVIILQIVQDSIKRYYKLRFLHHTRMGPISWQAYSPCWNQTSVSQRTFEIGLDWCIYSGVCYAVALAYRGTGVVRHLIHVFPEKYSYAQVLSAQCYRTV